MLHQSLDLFNGLRSFSFGGFEHVVVVSRKLFFVLIALQVGLQEGIDLVHLFFYQGLLDLKLHRWLLGGGAVFVDDQCSTKSDSDDDSAGYES